MRSRTRIIAAAAAVSAVVAAGSGVAVAASEGGTPAAHAHTTPATVKGGNAAKAGHDAMVAVVARDLHRSTAQVSAALAPLFAAGHAYPDSPVLAAAARSLGVSTQGLIAALTHAKLSLAGPAGTKQGPAGTKAGTAADKAGHDAMVATVASDLHLAVAQVSAALAPLFAAGHADTESPLFKAAARSLGVSAQQLNTALVHAKQSLASTSQP
jgi:2-hydroxychromene-2-carboxylate isomerase